MAGRNWGDKLVPLEEYFVHIDASLQGKKCSVDVRNDAERVRHWVVKWDGAGAANGHRGNASTTWIKTVLATVKRVWLPAGEYVRRPRTPGLVWQPKQEPDNAEPWTMRIHVGYRFKCMPQLRALAETFGALGDVQVIDHTAWWG